MPSTRSMKLMESAHRVLQRITAGKAGWNIAGMPVIELTTTGRKSGERRTTMLTSPTRDGEAYVVVASRGGDDRNPAWFLNLRDDPRVEVVIEGHPRVQMHASIADPEQRARLWPLITGRYANYAGYQKKTDREIPLVLLKPLLNAADGQLPDAD
ncbi:nitroreductase family deazaflavin-dependent oxidoreductase [Glaciihabitans sp. INWT7]|uniref:nitroreductase/quinone reductase family protein n=1 Tax=Glaciihabitans sp. INWT7 TaxID=2596912 RepID=UPI00162460E8|nr:nitroreductase/quinone reductase family protein [Glaciihabitans sp. INWT7]QNE47760.1 nitroreductase family deazaflavin-dependent oxidoreductase [Glaciihabitans sp. INWT7]